MLEVIQNEQKLLAAQGVDQLGLERVRACQSEPQTISNRGCEIVRLGQRSQLDQPHAVQEGLDAIARCRQRQLRLAHTARPHQGQQTASGRGQATPQFRQIGRAADQLGLGGREIMPRPLHGGLDVFVQGGRLC